MRRNVHSNQHADHYSVSTAPYHNIQFNDSVSNENYMKMNVISTHDPASNNNTNRFENTMEAKVEAGDTLQAIALRFHCTVADIRWLNKIDKDNEIHARKVVKIPVTVHNVLLDNLPTVHKSGSSSPKLGQKNGSNNSRDSNSGLSSIIRNPLEDAEAMLNEKLMVASVNSSSLRKQTDIKAGPVGEDVINKIDLKTKLQIDSVHKCTDDDTFTAYSEDSSAPLLCDILDDSANVPQLHRIRGPSLRAMDWSGSDCDMSWVCLFVIILALCFVIPLVYVFYVAEHSHHKTTGAISTVHH